MSEEESLDGKCGTCEWSVVGLRDAGLAFIRGRIIYRCTNPNSEMYSEIITSTTSCEEYEPKEN